MHSFLGGLQPRHLQHMSMEAFFELYQLWASGNECEGKEVAKYRTFGQIYHERWRDLICFRETSQHARCHGRLHFQQF